MGDKGTLDSKELLTYPSVRQAVSNSITYGLNQICERAYKSQFPVKGIARNFVIHLFPHFKIFPELSAINKEPVAALTNFWEGVSSVSGHDFGELERYALATDSGAPAVFLGQLISKATDTRNWGLADRYLCPVFDAVKREDYNPDLLARLN